MTEISTLSNEQIGLLPEQPPYGERLAAFEAEAAAEGYKFQAAVEVEFGFGDIREAIRIGRQDQVIDAFNAKGMNAIAPEGDIALPSDHENEEAVLRLMREAYEMVAHLRPHDPAEAARQMAWLACTEQLRLDELLNFRLYQEFARPTLGDTAVPKDADFEQMEQYGEQQGWLEFRYGNGELQSGWYDNPGTFELRLTPAEPAETARRYEIITQRAAEIAADHGYLFYTGGLHLNLSLYKEGLDDTYKSIIGLNPDRQAATLNAVAGLLANLDDGTWLNESSAVDVVQLSDFGKTTHRAGPHRTLVRILDDYFEYRTGGEFQTVAQGLLWLSGSVLYGEREGWGKLAAAGYEVPRLQPALHVYRTAEFQKERDLQIQRALENATSLEGGGFELILEYNIRRYEQMATAFFPDGDFKNKAEMMTFNRLVLRSLRLADDGQLSCTPASLRSAAGQLYEFEQETLQKWVSRGNYRVGDIEKVINERVKTVRGAFESVVQGETTYIPKDPEQWAAEMALSPAMRTMYGEYTEAHIARTAAIAKHTLATEDVVAAITKRLTETLGG